MVNRRLAIVLATAAALGGCESIASYRPLQYDPACTRVVLPSAGAWKMRLVNAGTRGPSDFCLRAAGSSDWGQPLFAAPSASCSAGLDYASATVAFAVSAASVDVKAIPPGASCDAHPTSELDRIQLGGAAMPGDPVLTVIRLGGEVTPEQIVARSEDPPAQNAGQYVRFVNAADDSRDVIIALPPPPATLPLSALTTSIFRVHGSDRLHEASTPGLPEGGAFALPGISSQTRVRRAWDGSRSLPIT